MAAAPTEPPQVRMVAVLDAPPSPPGTRVACLSEPEASGEADACPVIEWGEVVYWP